MSEESQATCRYMKDKKAFMTVGEYLKAFGVDMDAIVTSSKTIRRSPNYGPNKDSISWMSLRGETRKGTKENHGRSEVE